MYKEKQKHVQSIALPVRGSQFLTVEAILDSVGVITCNMVNVCLGECVFMPHSAVKIETALENELE